jgi:hypothetical protein
MLTQMPASVARVTTGDWLPAFQVVGIDAWGNRTSPCHDLAYTISGQCAALLPESFSVPVGADGVGVIEGKSHVHIQKREKGKNHEKNIPIDPAASSCPQEKVGKITSRCANMRNEQSTSC